MLIAVIAACSASNDVGKGSGPGSTPAAAPIPPPVQQSVGATGGAVTNSEGTGVDIPPGAVPGDVTVSVTPAPEQPPPPSAEPVGTPYVFGPSGIQFAVPVTITLAFDPAKLPAGTSAADVAVFTAPDGTTNYTRLKTTLKDATHVSAETTHFSVFLPLVQTGGTCTPIACQPNLCGTLDDGCGGSMDCGPCPTPDAGCTPVLCGAYGPGTCGPQPNGCGGQLDCGTCSVAPPDSGTDSDSSAPDARPVGDPPPDGGDDAGDGGASASDASPPRDPPPDGGDDAGDGGDAGPSASLPDCSPDATSACCCPAGACGLMTLPCGTFYCGPRNCSGGDGGGSTSDGGTAFDGGTCNPLTCANYANACGQVGDGCGKFLECTGGCDGGSGGSTDGGVIACVCPSNACGYVKDSCGDSRFCPCTDGGTCTPATCSEVPGACGPFVDGCGNSLDCGPCDGGGGSMMDGGACPCPTGSCGYVNMSCGTIYCGACTDGGGCRPRTCADMVGACGPVSDGCSAILDCGPCDGGGGGGGSMDGGPCPPPSCPTGSCGYVSTSCGMNYCGDCTDGGACKPLTCAEMQGTCGTLWDGCSTYLDCGPCDGGGGGGGSMDGGACMPEPCPTGSCGYISTSCGMNYCGSCTDGGACTPLTCADMQGTCGTLWDGCSTYLDCGPCDGGEPDAMPRPPQQ